MTAESDPIPTEKISRGSVAFNLFPSTPPSTDHHRLKNQCMATALFILMFGSSLAVLMFFTVTTKEIITINQSVENTPDLQQGSSPCPCTQVAIDYASFLRVDYSLHQVCSSGFVSDDWLRYLQGALDGIPLGPMDFRNMMLATFRALRTMCNLAVRGITNSLVRFYTNQYISSYIKPQELFMMEMQLLIDRFLIFTTNEILSTISTAHQIIQMDTLMSSEQTNAVISGMPGDPSMTIDPMSYGDCSCAFSALCSSQAAFYNGTSSQVLWLVPGMRTGCYVFNALLQSTLECLYDQMCFDQMRSGLNPYVAWNGGILDGTLPSHFTPNTSVNYLMSALMVEQWRLAASYRAYSEACAPTECNRTMNSGETKRVSYTVESKRSAISIVTTLIGLMGGLAVILKMMLSPGAAHI